MNYLTSKMKITIVGALIAALLFVQCNKMDDLNVRLEERYTTEFVEAAQTGALFRCAQCTESNTKITGNRAQLLAQNFAPLLKFDRAAPDYPTSVETVWANSDPASIVCDGQLVMVNRNSPSSLSFPTYYEVQQHPSRPNRVFIDYWWTYNIQSNCFSNLGGHDYDWEHVIVQVDTEANKVISVTYFQHGGWYTIDWRNRNVNDIITVFVGKLAHGSYHNSRSWTLPGYECSYWGDYRNPAGPQDETTTAGNLVHMDCNNPHFSFNGNWGTVGKGPLYRNRDYWNFNACSGTDGLFGQDGCSACNFGSSIKLGAIN